MAQQLVYSFGNGVIHLWGLALDHHHRQAVQKQHDVRDDMVFGSEDAHLELANGYEAVIVPVCEIHKTHRRAFLASLAVFAHAGVFEQQGKDMAVILNQAGAGEACGELFNYLFHLIVGKPGIDYLELLAQDWQHHHLREVLTIAVSWVLLAVEVEDFPA